MSDPCFYRYSESNLSAPYMKATKAVKAPLVKATTLEADKLNVTSLNMTSAGIVTYTGSFPISTTHTFTSTQLPPLGNQSANGELTLYLNNDTYAQVAMAVVIRTRGATLQALIYQNVGNFTSVASTISGNNVVITVSPAATCSWIYRGK